MISIYGKSDEEVIVVEEKKVEKEVLFLSE